MAHRQLKSDQRHPYQKRAYPFWRHSNLPPTIGYSEETRENFERFKVEFEKAMRTIQWITK